MKKLKLNDEVRVLEKAMYGNVPVGTVDVITYVGRDGTVRVGDDGKGSNWFLGGGYAGGKLELVKPTYPNPPHIHQKEIKAWADGAIIQWHSDITKKWNVRDKPGWCIDQKYRVKPAVDPRLQLLNEKLGGLEKSVENTKKEILSLG